MLHTSRVIDMLQAHKTNDKLLKNIERASLYKKWINLYEDMPENYFIKICLSQHIATISIVCALGKSPSPMTPITTTSTTTRMKKYSKCINIICNKTFFAFTLLDIRHQIYQEDTWRLTHPS